MKESFCRFCIAGLFAAANMILFYNADEGRAEEIHIEERTKNWVWPAEGYITDTYGTRRGKHFGIDIAGESGSPVYAVDGGIVTKSYYSGTYGHVVFVKHENSFETVYAHLKKRLVNEGQAVRQGDKIGEMGSTGRSSGVHLHFEVHENEWTIKKENAIDPSLVLGEIHTGETVHALIKKKDRAMETASKSVEQEEQIEFEGDFFVHIVQPGENLTTIAEKYNSTVSSIMKENKLENSVIFPKQELKIKKS